jgi:EAL domain-containing protein (putative c-di-GMP-specific phosphodiesterase class I)
MRLAEGTDEDGVTRAVIALGHSLGLPVVAEGVESAAVAAKLAGLGCATGQGRRWGGALPAVEVLARHANQQSPTPLPPAHSTDAA